MKAYKHIIYTAIVLSIVALFAANPVAARGESEDFVAGQEAGFVQVLNDSTYAMCVHPSIDAADLAKKASDNHVSKLMTDNRSDDFIRGFQASYEENWLRRADINCGT